MQAQSHPVRWGILGTGRITRKLAPAMQQAFGSRLVAIGSRSLDSAQAWAEKYGINKIHGSYLSLLEDPEIDAVYLPLPNSLHHEWTVKAAEHKKHILCEKPLGLSASEGKEMLAACRQHSVQFMDGVMWYHHPRFREMMNVINSGQLGSLRKVTTAFSFCWHETPIPEKEFRLSPEHGGGALYDLGWYCVGAILKVFQQMPIRLWATARYYHGVDMGLSAVLTFADGLQATLDCAFDTCFRNWLEVAGTTHSLVCDDFIQPQNDDKVRYWIHNEQGVSQEHRVQGKNQIVHLIEDFCSLASSGNPDYSWGEHSVKTQQVCDLIIKSAKSGQIVEL